MPKPRKGPHVYRRTGRLGLYAYIDRNHKDISLETQDEAEAHIRLAELLNTRGLRAISEGRHPVAAMFADYRERSKTNHTRKYAYETDLNGGRVLAWLEARNVQAVTEITKQTIEDYKTSRRFDKVSAARINSELQTWKKAMEMAVESGHAGKASLDWFVKLKEPRPLPHRVGLTKGEIERFLKAEKHTGYRALFRVAVGSGLRDDELRHLEATDVRPPYLVVTPKGEWTTKGHRHRSVPISKATQKAAKELAKAIEGGLVLEAKTVWRRIQAARKAAKITKHFSLHDLRRAYASHCLAAGYRLEQISQWLGHSDLLTTMRYLRVVDGGTVDTSKLPF